MVSFKVLTDLQKDHFVILVLNCSSMPLKMLQDNCRSVDPSAGMLIVT